MTDPCNLDVYAGQSGTEFLIYQHLFFHVGFKKKKNQISIKDKYQDFTIISLTQTRVLLGKQGVPYKNEQIVQIYIRNENHVPCSWNSAATAV